MLLPKRRVASVLLGQADQVEAENKRLNKARETLKAHKTEIVVRLKTSQEAAINIPKLENFIERVQGRTSDQDYEGKRLTLDMLGITVWLDDKIVEITGTINPEGSIVLTPTRWGRGVSIWKQPKPDKTTFATSSQTRKNAL